MSVGFDQIPLREEQTVSGPQDSENQSLLSEVLVVVRRLEERVVELEDAVAESNEHNEKLEKRIEALTKVVATKKQLKGLKELKKLRKFMDRIEVIDETEESPSK